MNKYIVFLLINSLFFSCLNKGKDSNTRIIEDGVFTIIVDSLPKGHDFERNVYVSGEFEDWSGGSEQFKLEKTNKIYSITIPKYGERIRFKFTQGNWSSVECSENGSSIVNRTYDFSNQSDTIRISVEQWSDSYQSNKPSTAYKNVHVYAENFEIPQLNRKRKISIYLPPDYHDNDKRYPVLYLQDGQNVFDESTAYNGKWEVDETLKRMYAETGFGLIVVAINHGEDKRLNEYSLWDNKKYGKGEAKAYLDFLVNNLKPEIDSVFKTISDKTNTAIMGSSLGGLFSHYAAFERPDVFGKAGVFSPSYWYAPESLDFTNQKIPEANGLKVYVLLGGREGEKMVSNVEKMKSLLMHNGFPENNLLVKIEPNGTHGESFWKAEFKDAITWLFNVN